MRRKLVGAAIMAIAIVTIATSSPDAVEGLRVITSTMKVKTVGQKLLEEHIERLEIQRLENKRLAKEAEAKRIDEAKKIEDERIAAEAKEAKRKAEAKKTETKIVASRGSQAITFRLSFYTALPDENGGHGLMANGKAVATAQGAVASNYYKLGTRIYLDGYGTYTVQDRGGSGFNNSTRLDVLILRKSGESDSAYKQRVMNMGRVEVKGWIQ